MALNPLRLQGLFFSAMALGAAALSVLAAPLPAPLEWWLASGLIVLLGVPHGALDPLFAQALPQLNSRAAWFGFVVVYLLLGALVVGLWWVFPMVFLVGFLAVSVLHFSGDLSAGAGWLARLVYGAAVITLPAAWHDAELLRLFSQLVGPDAARPVVAVLSFFAAPCLLALLLVAGRSVRHDGWRALEVLALGLLAWTATPLLGFAIYFCAMHSARHILRTQQYAGVSPAKLAGVALLPLLALSGLCALGWTLLPATPLDEGLLQGLFVGLAALTLPHMVLVERVRFAGWPARQ